jgi:hypothetical protein
VHQKSKDDGISNNVNNLFSTTTQPLSMSAASVVTVAAPQQQQIITVSAPPQQQIVTVAAPSQQIVGLEIEPVENFMNNSDIRMFDDYLHPNLHPNLQEEFNTFKSELRADLEKWKESIVKDVREAIVNEFAKSTVISSMMPRQSFLPMVALPPGVDDNEMQTTEGNADLLSRLSTKISDVARVNKLEADLNDAKTVTCYVRKILPIYNRFRGLQIYNQL